MRRRREFIRRVSGHVRAAWCLAAILVVISAGGAAGRVDAQRGPTPTRRALLIGIDQYLPPTLARLTSPNADRPAFGSLAGAVNDLEAMRAVLIARYGFTAANIRVLRNTDATRDRILTETRNWLVRAAAPGDVSVFFYAGHGSQVRNSKSAELDGLDETLVPSDWNLGRPDVRDKELARVFNEGLDKGVTLTAFVDSCHSGSIGRGVPRATTVRFAPPDPRDVANPDTPPSPESRGALILSASQDLQTAGEVFIAEEGGVVRGLFSWALVKTLRTMPVNESAERAFLRMRGLMQSSQTPQEPVLAGLERRRSAALFGSIATPSSGIAVAVQSIDDGVVALQGGFAAGLRPGAELKSADSTTGPVLRVVRNQGTSISRAEVASGSLANVRPGALFVVTKWVAPPGLTLRVWVPPSSRTAAQILADTQAGSQPGAADVPPPMEAASALRAGQPAVDRLVEFQRTPEDADYVLMGRIRNGGLEYAWTRPLASSLEPGTSMLPGNTAWVPLGGDLQALVARLRDAAVRLSVIRHWLQLESPPDTGTFPYRLALKHVVSGEVAPGGVVKASDPGKYDYGVVLRHDTSWLPTKVERRYVYVFAIDSDGKSTLVFPSVAAGNVENLFPIGLDRLPEEIPLGRPDLFQLSEGLDTFVLLTTATALADPSVLEGDAVRSAPPARDALSLLLMPGSTTRGSVTMATPVDWSIDRFTVRTVGPQRR